MWKPVVLRVTAFGLEALQPQSGTDAAEVARLSCRSSSGAPLSLPFFCNSNSGRRSVRLMTAVLWLQLHRVDASGCEQCNSTISASCLREAARLPMQCTSKPNAAAPVPPCCVLQVPCSGGWTTTGSAHQAS